MARYTYNASLVSQAIEELSSACKALDSTNGEIQKGISTVSSARGAENIDVDFSYITNYQSQVIEYIEMMSTEISGKAQEIEEYQSAPWYKKLFATIGMGALKLVEGLGSFVENLGDGVVSVFGFVGGIFNSDLQDACAEFVKKDHVGDFFYDQYEEGGLQWLNKYSVMSHQSTAANVLKGIGTATGYIIVGVATGGMGTAGLGISAATALVGGVGSGTQSGLQQGLSFNEAFGKGVKQGAVSAATTLVVGGLANKLTAGARAGKALDSLDELSGAASKTSQSVKNLKDIMKSAGLGDDVINLTDDIVGLTDDVANFADDAVTVGGTTAKSASTTLKNAKDLASKANELKEVAKAAGATDDVLNAIDDVVNNSANTLKVAKNANSAVSAARGTDAVVNEGNKFTKAVADSKIGQMATNVTQKVANSSIGQGLAKAGNALATSKAGVAVTNAANAIGPKAVGGVAAAAGQVTSGGITAPVQAAQFRMAENAGPSVGQKLYDATSGTLQDNLPDFAPQQSTAVDQITPTPTSTPDPTPTSDSTPKSAPTPMLDSTPRSDLTPRPDPAPRPDPTPRPDPIPKPDSDPISGGQRLPGDNDNKPIVNPSIGGGTGGGNYSNLTGNASTGNSNITSDDLMNSLGNSTGSLSDLTTSTMNIPTSSSPILSSDGLSTKSASVIPVVAGLGAAGLAGVGTKAYLDKREKDSDEDEEEGLETEEWNEDADSMNIDYGETENAEADYLTPTDEYAFQEG